MRRGSDGWRWLPPARELANLPPEEPTSARSRRRERSLPRMFPLRRGAFKAEPVRPSLHANARRRAHAGLGLEGGSGEHGGARIAPSPAPRILLGISGIANGAYCRNTYGLGFVGRDSSVALLAEAEILFAAEEERFSREEHSSSLPVHAFRAALAHAGLRPRDLMSPARRAAARRSARPGAAALRGCASPRRARGGRVLPPGLRVSGGSVE